MKIQRYTFDKRRKMLVQDPFGKWIKNTDVKQEVDAILSKNREDKKSLLIEIKEALEGGVEHYEQKHSPTAKKAVKECIEVIDDYLKGME